MPFTPVVQRNLRNRVSYTSYTSGSNPAQYDQGTFYTYDIEGNVDTLLQDYGSATTGLGNIMNANGNRWKRIVYQYDLVSGKVNSVAYQPHQVDAFYHRYTYDAENRLVLAESSSDSVYWDRDVRYEYYKHGPLARETIGDKQVQGLDYAYTLHGWLKGVNSTSLMPVYDMGGDGDTTRANRYIARDAYGFSLNYYTGDYAAIGTGATPFPGSSGYLNQGYRPLFNGNISSMAVNLGPLYKTAGVVTDNTHWRGPLLYNYRYDQLNRITGLDAYYGLNQTANSWAGLRGVSEEITPHVLYSLAKKGIAWPKGLIPGHTAHEDPEAHTMSDNESIFTSWTSNEQTAKNFAKGTSGKAEGVILSKKFKKSDLKVSNLSKLMQEYEYLVPGVVTGASSEPVQNSSK